MEREVKVGSAYFDIIAKSEQLKSTLRASEADVHRAAKNFEDAFRNAKLDIDNRILTMRFSQLQGLHKALMVQLNQKIKLDADVASIERTRIAISSVEDALGKMNRRSNNFSGVGMSFNRIIQDSAYVTQGFGFWINAIGNNITNFAENIQYARARGDSFKSMLSGMFTGVNLYIMILSAAVSIITAFANANRDAKESLKFDLTGLIGDLNAYADSIKQIKNELSGLSNVDLGKTIGELNKKLSELNFKKDAVGFVGALKSGGPIGSLLAKIFFPDPDEIKKESKKTSDALEAANAELVGRSYSKSYNFIKKRVEELQKDFYAGNTALAPLIKQLKKQLQEIDDLLDPDEQKKELGVLQPLISKLDTLEKLKPFAKTQQQAVDLQQAINSVNKELDDMKAKIKIMAEGRNTSLTDLPVKGADKIFQFNKMNEKHPGKMWDTDVYQESEPFRNVLKRIDEDIKRDEQTFISFSNTISSGLISGISAGESFISILGTILIRLTEMVAQALIFEWIFKMIAPAGLKSGGMFQGIFGRVLTQTSIPSSTFSGENVSLNTMNSAIGGKLDSINDSLQANTVNNLRGRKIVVPIYLDRRQVGMAVTEIQDEMDRGNVQGVRG